MKGHASRAQMARDGAVPRHRPSAQSVRPGGAGPNGRSGSRRCGRLTGSTAWWRVTSATGGPNCSGSDDVRTRLRVLIWVALPIATSLMQPHRTRSSRAPSPAVTSVERSTRTESTAHAHRTVAGRQPGRTPTNSSSASSIAGNVFGPHGPRLYPSLRNASSGSRTTASASKENIHTESKPTTAV